jgi:type II secretory pathway component GspD/PulD (secretin)
MEFFMGDLAKRGKDIADSAAAGSVIFGRTYGQLLDFLRTQTDTKYLARPRLLTLNNETAEIKITTQESVGVKTTTEATTGTTSAEPERTETGVSLRVTPQVNIDTGEITMFIHPEVSEATAGSTITSGDKSYQFRDPEIRSTKSIVKVKDGETVIVGGLIRNEFTQVVKKIPILGDIPVVGALFRHKNKSKDKERELLVFITPRLIKDTGTKFVSPRKVKLPTREQSASSVLDRQMSINTTLNTFEKTR